MNNITIVGAGISGLYAAMRLKQKYPDKQVKIFEKSDRLGGRIQTQKWGNFVIEYGPMRFEPDLQPKFADLINELQIETIDFSPYTSPQEEPDFNKLELEEIIAIKTSNYSSPAFALVKHALKQILRDIWNVDRKIIEDRHSRKSVLKSQAKFNDEYLYEQGIWDIFSLVLSKEAIDFLQNKGTFYHMLSINPNAADMICFMLDIIDTANEKLVTIKNGSYEIIQKLQQKMEELNVPIILNTSVVRFVNHPHHVTITTEYGDTFQTDRLLFTLNQRAYQNIDGFTPDIRILLKNSVMLLELFKLFVVFTNPPYDGSRIPKANTSACKIQCRELHYYFDDTTNQGMIQIYGDYPSINFWNSFMRNSAFISSQDHESEYPLLEKHIRKVLHTLFPNSDCEVLHYSMINWTNEPYNTGVHFWRPGYKSNEVIEKLYQIGNVHVCGEAFSSYQGFIEGALLSVDKVIHSEFTYQK